MTKYKIDRRAVLCATFCVAVFAADRIATAQDPTAKMYLTPVASYPGGAYNTGAYYNDSNINGQTLTVQAGGGRIYLDGQASD